MLRRAHDLVARARERIRAAAEHDPHAWPERDDDRAILVHDDEPIDVVEIPEELLADADGAHRAPARQPRSPAPPTSTAPVGGAADRRRVAARTVRPSARAG